ncbi:unnamed protein product [Rotaria sordida]|uniref:Tesmin/TSO1-like CXC domain-containing protein n=1 Tax=Rotaria sordida TaxID=392033 RepID=A0A815QW62_9BILA|nr:unnamed protein product [Rotaria sordida]
MNRLMGDCIDFKKNSCDSYTEVTTSSIPLRTPNGSSITFIRDEGNKILSVYDLKYDDILDIDHHHELIHNNRAMIAARIRECWSTQTCIDALPKGKVLVISGPDDTAVTLKRSDRPFEDYLLVSNHIEADTRLFIHAQAMSFDDIKSIVIQASDTDVIILAIAHALSLNVDNIFVKSFNTRAKLTTYINIREIALRIKYKFSINPIILLVIHALSGCDTTSFIKNISKPNMFRTFFSNTNRYESLNDFFRLPLTTNAISTAERLLLDCFSSSNTVSSLDALRGVMARSAFKRNRSSSVAPTLPPSNNAFYYHCHRASRQIQIWHQVYQSDMVIGSMDSWEGYEIIENEIHLKWLSIEHLPSDPRLSVCGKCSSNCKFCSCGKKGIVCTLLCKCSATKCENRINNSKVVHLNKIHSNEIDLENSISTNSSELNQSNLVESEDEESSRNSGSFVSVS